MRRNILIDATDQMAEEDLAALRDFCHQIYLTVSDEEHRKYMSPKGTAKIIIEGVVMEGFFVMSRIDVHTQKVK